MNKNIKRKYVPNNLESICALPYNEERSVRWERAFWLWSTPAKLDAVDQSRPVINIDRAAWSNVMRCWFKPICKTIKES